MYQDLPVIFNNQPLLYKTCLCTKSLFELIMLKQIHFREKCAESEIWERNMLLYTVTYNGWQYLIWTTKSWTNTENVCASKKDLDDTKMLQF